MESKITRVELISKQNGREKVKKQQKLNKLNKVFNENYK